MPTNKSKSEISDNTIDGTFSHANVIKDNGKIESQQNNNTVSDKENNNQIIQGSQHIIIQVNNTCSTGDTSEKITNIKAEAQISFMISGTGDKKLKTTLKALEKHLQGLADDVTMTIIDVDEGSLKFVLQGTPEGLERIERLFNSGELTEIFEVPIESVEFIEPEKEKLAFTITGDISYTDVAKLKAAVTGVDEKELLIKKIRTYRGKEKLNLRGADLRGAYLIRADLSEANLSGADLSGAGLRGAYLIRADLSEANLSGAYLSEAYLSGADLSGAYLNGAYLNGAYLSEAYLSRAYLIRADLSGADLREADLSGADLSGAYLKRTSINENTNLESKWRVVWKIVNEGGQNLDLREADLRGADLRVADLRGAYLIRADLIGADLRGADLRGAYLSGAYLIRADLSGADLSGAYLIRADLSEADLSGADLSGAYLRGANLSGADLSEADLSRAYLSRAELEKSIVINTKFSSNSQGMNEQLKQDLIQKGAIFEDSLEDPVLAPIRR
ncbi:MAG: pentapeptide repeat-containing protein [Okeania sp. SIO3H1]|nr:pentapeptide repeat-containing protein [Okeania sp. SIO3H1]